MRKIHQKTERIYSYNATKEGDRVKKSHRKIPFQMLAMIVGERWHSISPRKKQYYVAIANLDMERYKIERAEYEREKRSQETLY